MTVRPSAPQGHLYDVAYTRYHPVLNSVLLARNRMVTRVVAKQAKTTKVKNKFVNGKKKFKRIFSCLFGGRRKVQFRRKNFFALSVLLRSRSAHRLSSQHFAALSMPNMAELVLFGFFCPQPWFVRQSEHILPGKTSAFS